MKYAVIRIKGSQYKVNEKDEILVDKLAPNEEKELEVLMGVDGESVDLGLPLAKKTKVTVKRLDEIKGVKIQVRKYKAKSRYRRRLGFRPLYSKLQISKITL